ncbi:uncharacterized protein V6R79_016240 [Siganus canaliculatus]
MAAVKALQQWCRIQCEGYRDVAITNMTTSFRDGLAFCALIHKHRPELIDFDSLKKQDVYDNNKLAFSVAEEKLGIPALLDAEDMVALKVPDRLSILTYVSQYYNYFHGRSPIGGMGHMTQKADSPAQQSPGRKNEPVAAKVFPSSRPAKENHPVASSITTPSPSLRQNRKAPQVLTEKSNQTGTLTNKCVMCGKNVHLVQRHLVDGKLYHRSCAKSLSPANTMGPLRDLPTNSPAVRFAPQSETNKTHRNTGPKWLTEKTPTMSPSLPASKESHTSVVSKVTASTTPNESPSTTSTPANTRPVPAPRASTTAAKTLQSKLKFFQSGDPSADDVNKSPTATTNHTKEGSKVTGKASITVNVTGTDRKVANVNISSGGGKVSAAGESGKVQENSNMKAAAAAFISKKLTEENNNSSKPSWTTVAPKKADKPPHVETPKKEGGAVRGRVKLKADRSLLDDVQTPDTKNASQSPANWNGLPTRTPDRASDNETPADWRSKLKPISKDAKLNGADKAQDPEQPAGPAASAGFAGGRPDSSANGAESRPAKLSKSKQDYIQKADIIKELQEIEDNLNELERRGVDLEMKLRSCEEDGEDDSLMDELMVEWFTLIRNKQVAMRRESELVYIGKTQDLEEEQPSVERELRRLMEKPEHLKTSSDRRREEELMTKLMDIIKDRNAIVEGLDEDRLREEEEDEELDKMMKTFNVKKEKPKKKSPMSKLFGWGNKKEG